MTGTARLFTPDNWGYPPYNRTSFQHVQQLFPTTRLKRGLVTSVTMPTAWQDLSGISYADVEGNLRTLAQMLDDTFTDAFVVAQHGTLIAEDYRNNMTAASHHLLNSVSKSFLGMLVGILAADNSIDPARPVAHYIPEFSDTGFRNTTVQQALDMTGAVAFGEDYADRNADFWREAAVVGWRPALVQTDTPKTLFEYACSLQHTEQQDGEHFHYRTVFTNVVAMAVERATRQPVAALLEEKLWQPLKPEQDASVVVDSSGFPYFGAGMSACARDLARFGQMLAQDGELNGVQIVPAEWVADTLHGNKELKRLFAEGDYAEMTPGGHYRNQVWADSDRQQLICIGIHGQTIFVDQSNGVVIVKLSTHPESAEMSLFADTFDAMRAVAQAL